MAHQTFEFIVIDETGKPQSGLKRKVRSHSSRVGWARHSKPDIQRHRQKRKRPYESTTYIGTEQPYSEDSSSPILTLRPNSFELLLDRRFGGVRLDPFQAYPPVRWASFIPSLVDHCKQQVHRIIRFRQFAISNSSPFLRYCPHGGGYSRTRPTWF